jgi:hypothetical protein
MSDQSARSSVYVAPLNIDKASRSTSVEDAHRRTDFTGRSIYMQMTPPDTPIGLQDASEDDVEAAPAVFYPFLRAFYPFQPSETAPDSTVTLPLREGDVVLVHSIHTNGWADGTLLPSGARGWLPTNYCEGYEPEAMRSLLKGLLNFWDLLRTGMTPDDELFANQEFMRGIIAGVRYLLVSQNPLVTAHSTSIYDLTYNRRSRIA